MAPCEAFTMNECLKHIRLNSTKMDDAELLCHTEGDSWVEVISADTVAIVMYLVTNIYIQIAECSLNLNNSSIWSKGTPHYEEGRNAIVRSATVNCFIGFVLYAATTCVVYELGHPLDNRARAICLGASQLFAGVLFLILSIQLSQWFGIYHSNKNKRNSVISFTSGKEIQFHLSWRIWNLLLSMYFFQFYFSTADRGQYGALISFPCSFLVVYILMLARSPEYKKYKHKICIMMVICFGIGSWSSIFTGIWFIYDVWHKKENPKRVIYCYSLLWFLVVIGCHLILYYWTCDKQSKGDSMRFISDMFRQPNLNFCGKSSVVASQKNETEVKDEEEGNNNNEEEKHKEEEVVMPPLDSSNKEGQEEKEEQTSRHINDVNGSNDDDHNNGSNDKRDDDDNNRNNRVSLFTGYNESKSMPVLYIDPNDAPSYWKLLMKKLVDAFPFICGCCLKGEDNHDSDISQSCINYHNVTEIQPKSSADKILDSIKRFIWCVVSFLFFFSTIINIGASYEQCAAKNELQNTFNLLYPDDYNTGTMCAWEKNGQPGPDISIKEFDTVQEVQDANYEVIHCGACGVCSNWNDIKLQYTTRRVLSGVTKACAQKSIFNKVDVNDDDDEVVECNHLQVGFTLPCAKAWAWDEINTKDHALFTYLQALLSNSFADMKISFQDITMATIDEAISGPGFVPKVGATRRRMNIVSDIRRPHYQKCTAAQQDWSKVFNNTFDPPCGGTYVIQEPNLPKETVVIVGQNDPC